MSGYKLSVVKIIVDSEKCAFEKFMVQSVIEDII